MSEKLTHGQPAGENGMNENRFGSDVDAAFDPEKRQAQQDWDNYLAGRNYKDGNGSVHDAETGRFAKDLNSESEDEYYNRIHEQAESTVDARFADASLFEIADMVRNAKKDGDRTTADDAFDAFAEKFDAMREKYGWTEETTNVRMDRFAAIMEGDAVADNARENTQTSPSFEKGQQVRVLRTSGDLENDWTVQSVEDGVARVTKPSPDGDGTLVKDIPVVDLANAQPIENETSDTLSKDNAYSEEDTPMFDEEGEVNPEAALALASDELEMLDESDDSKKAKDLDEIAEGETAARSRKEKVTDAILHPFASAAVWRDGRRAERNGRLMSRRERIIAIMGGAAVMAVGAIMTLKGHDVFSSGHGSGSGLKDLIGDSVHDAAKAAKKAADHAHDGNGVGSESIRVHAGDGEIKVTQHILDKHGVHVNATDAQHIGEKANVDLLVNDNNYDDAHSTLNRIGDKPGLYKVRNGSVEALLRTARKLGFRR